MEGPQQSPGLKVTSAAQSKGPTQQHLLLLPHFSLYSREKAHTS